MARYRIGPLAAVVSLAMVLSAQEPPALPILEHVPADHGNLIYLGDPLPPLEGILSSRELAALLERSPTLRSLLEEEGLHLETLALQLGMVRSFLPREALLATPERTATDLARLVHATVTGAHAVALQRIGGDARLGLADDGTLWVRIGEPGAEHRTTADLGPLWQPTPLPLLFTTWSFEEAQTLGEAAYEVWVQHSETPAEDWLWDYLPEGTPLSILNAMEQVLDAFAIGSMALRVDNGLDMRQQAARTTRFGNSPPSEVGRSRCRGADVAHLLEQAREWTAALTDPDAGRLLRVLGAEAPREVADALTSAAGAR